MTATMSDPPARATRRRGRSCQWLEAKLLDFERVSTSGSQGGRGVWLGESVATFGLLIVIFGVVRSGRAAMTPFAVGAYITGAYFFTSSTSFANPAVSVARMLSNSFAGIAPSSVPLFVAFELA